MVTSRRELRIVDARAIERTPSQKETSHFQPAAATTAGGRRAHGNCDTCDVDRLIAIASICVTNVASKLQVLFCNYS